MFLAIDFGTSFSKVAIMYLGQPFLLHPPGDYGLPSEFYYDNENGILIGQDAIDAAQGFAAVNLKSEVKMDLKNTFRADGRVFTSMEMVQAFYRTLVLQAQRIAKTRAISEKIEGLVITIPAKFNMQERTLLLNAAKTCIPGQTLNVTAVVKEPVAAALSYFHDPLTSNSSVLVFDLGGGTCDVALVREKANAKERFDVEDADMIRVGGRDWDKELIDYIVAMAEKKSGLTIRGNAGYMEKVRRAAITVKHQLSESFRTQAMGRIEINGRMYMIPVTRDTFDEITSGLLRKVMDCMEGVYERNKAKFNITEIICVGGSSNMPQIEEGIKARFPQCNVHIHVPEHAVVNGAAIYSEMLGPNPDPSVITDFTSFSYGIRCYEDYSKDRNKKIIVNILRAGAKLPAKGRHSFCPVSDDHVNMLLSVFESEHPEKSYLATDANKRQVGELVFHLAPDSTTDTVVTCTLNLDQNGLLQVRAVDDNGRTVEAEFHVKDL